MNSVDCLFVWLGKMVSLGKERREALRPLFLSVRGFTVLMTAISGLRTMISGLMPGVVCPIEDGFCALFRVLSKCGKSRHHSLVLKNAFLCDGVSRLTQTFEHLRKACV